MTTEGRLGVALVAVILVLFLPGAAALAAAPYLEVQLSTVKQSVTASRYGWMSELAGDRDQHYAVFRLGPLAAGASYAVTLRFERAAGLEYSIRWLDGDPAGGKSRPLLGLSAEAGFQGDAEGGHCYLFTVDGRSTSNLLYLVVGSDEPASLSVGVTGRPPRMAGDGAAFRDALRVTDLDAEGKAPFLLSASAPVSVPSRPDPAAYVDLLPNMARRLVTAPVFPSMPSYFGRSEGYYTVLRMAPLARGRRYELTLTYDAGTAVEFSSAWVDGDPLGWDFWPFARLESSTGTRAIRNKQQKFLFTVDPESSTNTLYLVVHTGRRWPLSVGLTDRPYGVLTADSLDAWGERYVTDLDAEGAAPFLLTRARR